MDLEKLSKMLKKSLSRGDFIKLCHFGIALANMSSSDKKKKKKGNETQQCLVMSGGKKKSKRTDST